MKSVSRAAERLHVTKSAISQSIKNLEMELGEELFLRTGGKLEPTQFGQELFQVFSPVMSALSTYVGRRKLEKDNFSGTIRIVAPPLFLATFLLPAVADFTLKHPNVRYELRPYRHILEAISMLESDRIDLCIVDSFEVFGRQRASIVVTPLFQEAECLACARSYFERALKKRVNYDSIAKAQIISYDRFGTDIKTWLKMVFKKKPDQVAPLICVEDYHAMFHAVKTGLGLGILPVRSIIKELKSGQLIAIRGIESSFQNKLSILHSRRSVTSKLVLTFISKLVKSATPQNNS